MKRTDPYTGPFPRKRHSHKCKKCVERGQLNAVACYKHHWHAPPAHRDVPVVPPVNRSCKLKAKRYEGRVGYPFRPFVVIV